MWVTSLGIVTFIRIHVFLYPKVGVRHRRQGRTLFISNVIFVVLFPMDRRLHISTSCLRMLNTYDIPFDTSCGISIYSNIQNLNIQTLDVWSGNTLEPCIYKIRSWLIWKFEATWSIHDEHSRWRGYIHWKLQVAISVSGKRNGSHKSPLCAEDGSTPVSGHCFGTHSYDITNKTRPTKWVSERVSEWIVLRCCKQTFQEYPSEIRHWYQTSVTTHRGVL